ncbi:hypothetical protein HZ992_14825 [Rhizobacter sp. AJA081-3]|uniref:hypothetical protein n=1 Tax=Rhizobacter sp. AJA081-3 TaxID=2753607 RepID=UPI001ADF866C|nr:hypothetical protein [Rhizobacter sp. AJA081-3]QTN21458.1 hypothetical protein HZ992_14825 [Rhizobacter sp. AJA081-3]
MRLIFVAVGAFVASVVGLALAGVAIWRLRCEGFGCIGIGVAWFAWVTAFALVLVVGLVLHSRPSLGKVGVITTRAALIVQAILALVALAAWFANSAA